MMERPAPGKGRFSENGGDASAVDFRTWCALSRCFTQGVVVDEVTDTDQPRADLFWADPLGAFCE